VTSASPTARASTSKSPATVASVRRFASEEDGRSVHVALTPEGHALGRELTAEISELLAPLTSSLSAAERRRLGELQGRMRMRA